MSVKCKECNDTDYVEGEPCQECCLHEAKDHSICIDCGKDFN